MALPDVQREEGATAPSRQTATLVLGVVRSLLVGSLDRT
jgi:hypothetical protein